MNKDEKATVCGRMKTEDLIKLDEYCKSIGWTRSQLMILVVNWYVKNHDRDHAIKELLKHD